MEKNLKESQKKAVQYWFADGLAELSGGILTILLAIYFVLVQLFPNSSLVTVVIFFGVFIIAFGIRWLMLSIRTRTTYPRTGYIAPKSGWEDRRLLIITGIFTVILMAVMFYLVFRLQGGFESLPVIGGSIMAFIFAMMGFETKLVRFIYLAITCFLFGLVLAFSGLGNFWGVAVLSLATSLILFAFGSITRLQYLRHTSMPMENTNEH